MGLSVVSTKAFLPRLTCWHIPAPAPAIAVPDSHPHVRESSLGPYRPNTGLLGVDAAMIPLMDLGSLLHTHTLCQSGPWPSLYVLALFTTPVCKLLATLALVSGAVTSWTLPSP